MNDKDDIRIGLLLFSVCGVCFGVDAEQVTGIEAYCGESDSDLFWFHEEFKFGCATSAYLSPMVATIRTDGSRSYRIVIDSMEDIAEFSQNDIRLFPPMVESFAIRKGLWGILPRNGILVLLVDFKRMLKETRSD